MGRQYLPRSLFAFIDDPADLLIDNFGGRLGNILTLGHRVSEEDLFLILAVTKRPELFAEPEFGDHPARQSGRAADVVGSPCGDLVRPEDQLFGDTAAEEA